MAEASGPKAGWYDDPERPDRKRYWDGQRWTEDVRDAAPTPEPLNTPAAAVDVAPRRSRRIARAVLVLAVVGLAGWFLEASRSAPKAPVALKLGYLLPESGLLEGFGPPMTAGVQIAVAEINSAGGLFGQPIELLRGDEGGSEISAAEEATRLLDAGVQAIVGAPPALKTWYGEIYRSVVDTIREADVVLCSPSNSSAELSSISGRNFFSTVPSDVIRAPALADVVLASGAKRIALVAPDNGYGYELMIATVANLQSRGAIVTIQELFDPVDWYVSETVDALIGTGADVDAYVVISELGPTAKIVSGLLDAGVAPTAVFVAIDWAGQLLHEFLLVPSSMLDGVTSIEVVQLTAKRTAESAIDRRIGRLYPLQNFTFASTAYDCVNVIALAAVQGGSTDPRTIQNNLVAVTTGDFTCSTFVQCRTLLEDGKTIAYQASAGGSLALTETDEGGRVVSVGTIGIYRWFGGDPILEEFVEVDLRR